MDTPIYHIISSVLDIGEHAFSLEPVQGGDIHDAYCIKTSNGQLFGKFNTRYPQSNMFEQEAFALDQLRRSTFKVPEVIHFDEQCLILEWIESGIEPANYWVQFGRCLAQLHQIQKTEFGFSSNNYIGPLVQLNTISDSWSTFFSQYRLTPLVKLAVEHGKINKAFIGRFERLYQRIDTLFPSEKASLLHGDLWSGNSFCSAEGQPTIFDPASYYGHREMDLAMTQLFGGFSSDYLAAYHEINPLEIGWQERMDVCNLYPLLVHVNLFGGSYARSVEHILNRFI